MGFLATLAFWLFIVPGLAFLAFCFMLLGAFFPQKTIAVGGALVDAVVMAAKQIFTVIMA